ncbi:hypothetical protein QTO34_006944 [Cnephaeus nilssonii]|uniref:FHA domain-containing protein n=1 Tax=Cnephaeus nilssonii TaxID=3371016 RepID=A0AA40HJB8_CNENI|nr:hypothetical protein QTO34_006944 [Eptesicus nilssonii]
MPSALAIFTCRPNSHPFQERHVYLDEPIKIGRSVARCRPAQNNATFDCKVLSRNHALVWFDHKTGKRRGGAGLGVAGVADWARVTLSSHRQRRRELSVCAMAVLWHRRGRGLWGSELTSRRGPSKAGELGGCPLWHQAFQKPLPRRRLLKGLVHQRTGTQLPVIESESVTWASLRPLAGTRDLGFPRSPGFVWKVIQKDKHLEYLEQFVEAFPFDMPMVQKDTRTFDGSIWDSSLLTVRLLAAPYHSAHCSLVLLWRRERLPPSLLRSPAMSLASG